MLYTLRLITSSRKGSGLSEPGADIQIGIFGQSGRFWFHTFKSPELNRFQGGSIDELTFEAPDLGDITSLAVAPLEGSWRLEEAQLSAPGWSTTVDFPNTFDVLVGGKDDPGVMLPAAESVVRPRELSPEDKARLRGESMEQYAALKQRSLLIAIALVTSGAVAGRVAGGGGAGAAFGCGGLGGVVYLALLQREVDALGAPAGGEEGGEEEGALSARLLAPFLSGPGRLLLVACLAVVGASRVGGGAGFLFRDSAAGPAAGAAAGADPRVALVAALLGFFTYKVAIVLAALTEPAAEAPGADQSE